MNAPYTRNLVLEGYSVLANRARLFFFLVVKPCGTVYEVNPVADTCTCAAGQNGRRCCHRTQLQSLLRAESRRLLALSAQIETADPTQALMLVCEVEELVAQWKDVKEARSRQITPPVCAAAFHDTPSRFAIWGQNSRNRAWVCLGKEFRSREQAEKVRATVYAVSSRYAQTSVRPFRAVAVSA